MVKNLPANAGDVKDSDSVPGSGRFPWRRKWQPIPVFLPGESHGQRSLADHDDYSISSKGFLPTVVNVMVI